MRIVVVALLALFLSGCLVRTAANVATTPVRAVGWTADKLTTSQSEADEKRGREMRKQDERDRKEAKRRAKELKRERDRLDGESNF